MGFMLKSAMGLGSVYYLMFSCAAERVAQSPAATLCAHAAVARLHGDVSLLAEAQAARCLIAVNVAATSPRAAVTEKPAPALSGGLTQADLSQPWFGPGGLARKTARRG